MSERNLLIKLNWGKFAVGWKGRRRELLDSVTWRLQFSVHSEVSIWDFVFLSSVLLGRRVVLQRHLISPRWSYPSQRAAVLLLFLLLPLHRSQPSEKVDVFIWRDDQGPAQEDLSFPEIILCFKWICKRGKSSPHHSMNMRISMRQPRKASNMPVNMHCLLSPPF